MSALFSSYLLALAPAANTQGEAVGLRDELWFYLSARSQTDEVQFWFAVFAISVVLAAFCWRSWQLHTKRNGAPEERRQWLRWGERLVSAALLVAALASTTQYFYAQRNNGVWLHRWDLYHQIIGAKYFSELGYFKIYECTVEIDETHSQHFKGLKKMRNIETLAVKHPSKVLGERDCEGLFTPERLDEFVTDIDAMVALDGNPERKTRPMSKKNWHKLFGDKGFNGTPFHAWALRTLTSNTDIVWEELRWLALLDVFVMFMAFGFVVWAWGPRHAAIVVLFFCSNFPNRFIHMGGSILRFDYIAALIIALALMKKDRKGVGYALAGMLVAWATAERVFPAVFAVGLALKAGIELLLTRKLHREYLMFGAAFVGGLLLLFMLSLNMGETMGAGVDGWLDWWHNMKEHTRHTRGFRVGFKHMFMMDGNVTDGHRFVGWAKKTGHFHTRDHFFYLSLLVLFGPLVLAARKLDAVTFTAIFCAAGFFCLTVATRYYYSVMVLFLLVDRELFADRKQLLLAALLLLTGAWLTKVSVTAHYTAFKYNTASSAAFAGYFVLLGAMLWIDPWHREPPLLPAPAAEGPPLATTDGAQSRPTQASGQLSDAAPSPDATPSPDASSPAPAEDDEAAEAAENASPHGDS